MRELEDRRVRTLMRVIHAEWGGIFGYRRMREILRTPYGERLGERRVRRLMAEASLTIFSRDSSRVNNVRVNKRRACRLSGSSDNMSRNFSIESSLRNGPRGMIAPGFIVTNLDRREILASVSSVLSSGVSSN